jgi:hypothetical protein
MADADIVSIVFLHCRCEARIGFAGAIERIGIGVYQAVGTFVVGADDRVICNSRASNQRLLHAEPASLFGELERVRSGQHLADHIALRNLRDIRGVVRSVERRPQLLHDLAAAPFENALEAANLLIAESKIVTHAGGALELHFIEHVVGERIEALS